MFKKLVKSAIVLALASGGSAFAMQKPTPPTIQGRATVGLSAEQTAAQKSQFAKLLEQAQAKKAAAQAKVTEAKAKVAAAATQAEKQIREKLVSDAQHFVQMLKDEEEDLKRAIEASRVSAKPAAAVPAWPTSVKPSAPSRLPLAPAAAAPAGQREVFNPFTGTTRFVPAAEAAAYERAQKEAEERAGGYSSSSSRSSSPSSSPRSSISGYSSDGSQEID